MDARSLDDAAARLRNLRREQRANLVLAAAALVLAVATTQVDPSLARPLFLGGATGSVLGMRALCRRWDLLEWLSAKGEAHVIAEVRALAARQATMDKRREFAAVLRRVVAEPGYLVEARVRAAAAELEELAAALIDIGLELEPAAAVACKRLVTDFTGSPLLDPVRPPEELRSRVRQIRSGFRPGIAAA
jgi:hypothetical protein